MPYRTNLIYHYDGSYQGFLCCVAQCFQAKELPVDIRAQEDEQQSLFGRRDILSRLCIWCGRGFSPACPSGRWPCCAFC